MVNKFNAFKEKLSMSLANLLPKPVAYWAFIRVATFECPGNPGEQPCVEAAKRWSNPVNSLKATKRKFFGPAYAAAADELTKREELTTQDPVHECVGFWWFWDETWMNRIGPYSTADKARFAAVLYGRYLNSGDEDSADVAMLPDVKPEDGPLNKEFQKSFDGAEWAKAFINRITLMGDDAAHDLDFVRSWFSNAIMRGYDESETKTKLALAELTKSVGGLGKTVNDVVAQENRCGCKTWPHTCDGSAKRGSAS